MQGAAFTGKPEVLRRVECRVFWEATIVIIRGVLAIAVVGIGTVAGASAAMAQARSEQVIKVQATTGLPGRRPEEAQADLLQAFDINKNGRLELAEVKSAAAARYDELDPDQDDKLDAREAGSVLRDEAFRRADTDGDGTVSKAEYLAYVEKMFELANPDKDGSLDRAELSMEAGQTLLKLLR